MAATRKIRGVRLDANFETEIHNNNTISNNNQALYQTLFVVFYYTVCLVLFFLFINFLFSPSAKLMWSKSYTPDFQSLNPRFSAIQNPGCSPRVFNPRFSDVENPGCAPGALTLDFQSSKIQGVHPGSLTLDFQVFSNAENPGCSPLIFGMGNSRAIVQTQNIHCRHFHLR